MDILKFIFHHDLLVEQLEGSDQDRTTARTSLSIEDFMKPMPTYSRFYLSGTVLESESFALSSLHHFDKIKQVFSDVFQSYTFHSNQTSTTELWDLLDSIPMNAGIVGSLNQKLDYLIDLEGKEYVREYGLSTKTVLEKNDFVLFKVANPHGYDLQLFSIKNWYPELFYGLKPLINPSFRVFSINGKKVSGDRMYYFETYRLDNPPHGFEEVFPDTVY